MLALVVFLMAVYGLANALTVLKFGRYFFGTWKKEDRKFLGKIPFFGDIFYCPPCISFYIGMAVSIWFLSPSRVMVPIWWKAAILDGLAAVAFSYLAHATAEKLTHGLDV